MYTEIRFTLNGEQKLYQGDPLRRLLDVLREDYGLTGSKEGCGEGECGACSIIKNGELVTSCIIPVGTVNGCELTTIEGNLNSTVRRINYRYNANPKRKYYNMSVVPENEITQENCQYTLQKDDWYVTGFCATW